jgi:hypothetical protein
VVGEGEAGVAWAYCNVSIACKNMVILFDADIISGGCRINVQVRSQNPGQT